MLRNTFAIACIHARYLKLDGSYETCLVAAKSKIVSSLSIPKAELKSCTVGAILSHVCSTYLKLSNILVSNIYVTDSMVALQWLNTDQRPLMLGIRNNVIEVRRFSEIGNWYLVQSGDNIADLGTRQATIHDIGLKSEWQLGKKWMSLERKSFPILSIDEIKLSA